MAEDVAYLEGRACVLVINDNWRLAPWADVHYGADLRWWEHHWNEVSQQTRCERWTVSEEAAGKFGLQLAITQHPMGLSNRLGVIHLGQLPERQLFHSDSGFQAIQLAYQKGARRIVLLGFDLQHTGGRAHWFGDHPKGLNNAPSIEAWRPKYDHLAPLLEHAGVEVINCTRETALTAFPRRPLRSVL